MAVELAGVSGLPSQCSWQLGEHYYPIYRRGEWHQDSYSCTKSLCKVLVVAISVRNMANAHNFITVLMILGCFYLSHEYMRKGANTGIFTYSKWPPSAMPVNGAEANMIGTISLQSVCMGKGGCP